MVTIADTGPTRDLDVAVDTDPGLISADMAAQLAACVETLLLRGLEDATCPVGRLPIMSEATQERLRGFSAGETVALPEGATLATLLRRVGRTDARRGRPDIGRAATELLPISMSRPCAWRGVWRLSASALA